jgi:hypothetical protein
MLDHQPGHPQKIKMLPTMDELENRLGDQARKHAC